MSYLRRVTGCLTISPGLSWGTYRHHLGHVQGGFRLMRWVEHTDLKHLDEGELTIRSATGLEPVSEELWDNPAGELTVAANVVRNNGGVFHGAIYVVGQDGALDTWRYYPDEAGGLQVEQAILVWPTGRRAHEARPRSDFPGQENLTGRCLTLSGDGPVAWPDPIDPSRMLRESPWSRG